MKQITFLLIAVAALAGVVAITVPASLRADEAPAPIFVTKIPPGYRDWRLISVAHEEGNLNSFAPFWATMWRSRPTATGSFHSRTEQSLPLCTTVTSRRRKTTKSLADPQSFVAGPPTNIQFMVKDSKKYAATGGWGFAHFSIDGKPSDAASMKTCFPCHNKSRLATWSSRATHLSIGNHRRPELFS